MFAHTGPAYVSTPKHPWILELAWMHSHFWLYNCTCVCAHLRHTLGSQDTAIHLICELYMQEQCTAIHLHIRTMRFSKSPEELLILSKTEKNWVSLSPSVPKVFIFKEVASEWKGLVELEKDEHRIDCHPSALFSLVVSSVWSPLPQIKTGRTEWEPLYACNAGVFTSRCRHL